METMADALGADSDSFWSNKGALYNWWGCELWGMSDRLGPGLLRNYHSWDSLKNCLKYGFSVRDGGDVCANTTDEEQLKKGTRDGHNTDERVE